MAIRDEVNVINGKAPADYHCKCKWCKKYLGELRPTDGSYYSRLERRKYYADVERGKGGHIAKTPLHVARWAVQQYTDEGDWVLDPTIGAGTTAVEALTQGCSVAGMELEYGEILKANVKRGLEQVPSDLPKKIKLDAKVAQGDARNIADFLKQVGKKYSLIVNNPPYSGDVSMPSPSSNKEHRGKEYRHEELEFKYDEDLPNLAFLREGDEYWDALRSIYVECAKNLMPGGHFVVGTKDMMRNKEPFLLHKMIAEEVLAKIPGMSHVGTALLRHHPSTLFQNTYKLKYGIDVPRYQTIVVFRKE